MRRGNRFRGVGRLTRRRSSVSPHISKLTGASRTRALRRTILRTRDVAAEARGPPPPLKTGKALAPAEKAEERYSSGPHGPGNWPQQPPDESGAGAANSLRAEHAMSCHQAQRTHMYMRKACMPCLSDWPLRVSPSVHGSPDAKHRRQATVHLAQGTGSLLPGSPSGGARLASRGAKCTGREALGPAPPSWSGEMVRRASPGPRSGARRPRKVSASPWRVGPRARFSSRLGLFGWTNRGG